MREKRLTKMEEFIRKRGSVSLDELCVHFGVSKNTVRRDVAEIVEHTDIRKIYGGVSVQRNVIPPPFTERSAVNQDIKERLGRKAAQLVKDGDIIYIDSGTTTCRMVDYLKDKSNVTVVTHSLDVINRAVAYPGLNVIALSGTLNRKTFSFTGQSTIDVLQEMNISKAFMAANGLSVKNGATQSTSIEFAIKKCVVSRSDAVYLMIERRKIGAVSLLTYCPLERVDAIITEKKPEHGFCEEYDAMGGQIILSD